jgi:hypothetical protein
LVQHCSKVIPAPLAGGTTAPCDGPLLAPAYLSRLPRHYHLVV